MQRLCSKVGVCIRHELKFSYVSEGNILLHLLREEVFVVA